MRKDRRRKLEAMSNCRTYFNKTFVICLQLEYNCSENYFKMFLLNFSFVAVAFDYLGWIKNIY